MFLGSLVYLYVVFTWYNGGATAGAWLNAAAFLSPFVIAVAIVSAITLFFMGLGAAAGMKGDAKMADVLWKFIILGGITTLIVTGGGGWFYVALVGFVLTYLGGSVLSM